MNDFSEEQALEDRIRLQMRQIGASIASGIEATGVDYGFALFIFERKDGGKVNFVSDIDRRHMIGLMKDFIANAEADMIDFRSPPLRQ